MTCDLESAVDALKQALLAGKEITFIAEGESFTIPAVKDESEYYRFLKIVYDKAFH